MVSHPRMLSVRRSSPPRDFFRPGDFDLIPLPSPNANTDNAKPSGPDSSGDDGGSGNGSGSNGGSDDGQSKGHHNQQDNQQDGGHRGGDNHNNDSGDDTPASGGAFPCTANGLPIPPFPGCFSVNDRAPFFKYIGNWTVSSLDGNGKGSIHQATSPGAGIEISVDGTGFALFGIIPPSNETDRPPSAVYTVDNATSSSTTSTLPFATDCQRNQNFFQVNNLPQRNHTITVNVTHASQTAPYIIEYMWICGISGPPHGKQPTSTTQPVGASSKPTVSDAPGTRSRDAIIVGSVLGSMLLLLASTFFACFYIRRRRRRQNRLRGLHLAVSPVTSWLRSHSGSRETATILTSTESIMRDNPTYSSSADTKDLEKIRRDVVSMPPSIGFSSTTRTYPRPPSSQPPGMSPPIERDAAHPTAITTT